jgi:hypothetical protein
MEYNRLIHAVEKSIIMAERGKSKLSQDVLSLEGWSSDVVRHFFNNIVRLSGKCNYLETGVWKGSTFISAMYRNYKARAIAIENFCTAEKDSFIENTTKYLSDIYWELLEIDCTKQIPDFKEKIDIYFYDGPHEMKDQRYAFTAMDKNFRDMFIAIIDDWNWDYVREGTRQALEELNYKIIKEWEYFSTGDINKSSFGDKQQGKWWNGTYIGIIEKWKN